MTFQFNKLFIGTSLFNDYLLPLQGNREMETTFNSLKKIKRALVGGGGDGAGNGESLDSNWVLSRSVPTSLNKGQLLQVRNVIIPARIFFHTFFNFLSSLSLFVIEGVSF